MQDYYDLGTYSRKVSTFSETAQTWFDRGLVWCYAYHHQEAAECFARAIAADPDCAMAHWGLAYVMGCNYNKPWAAFDPQDAEGEAFWFRGSACHRSCPPYCYEHNINRPARHTLCNLVELPSI